MVIVCPHLIHSAGVQYDILDKNFNTNSKIQFYFKHDL